MANNTTGTSCLGPLAGLQAQQKLYQDTVRALGDPAHDDAGAGHAGPRRRALREAERTSGELADAGRRQPAPGDQRRLRRDRPGRPRRPWPWRGGPRQPCGAMPAGLAQPAADDGAAGRRAACSGPSVLRAFAAGDARRASRERSAAFAETCRRWPN